MRVLRVANDYMVEPRSPLIVTLAKHFTLGTPIPIAAEAAGVDENTVAMIYVLFSECLTEYAFKDDNQDSAALNIFQDSARLLYCWIDGGALNKVSDVRSYVENRLINNLRKAMRFTGVDSEKIDFQVAEKFWRNMLIHHLDLIESWTLTYGESPPDEFFNALFIVFDHYIMKKGRQNILHKAPPCIPNEAVVTATELISKSIEANNSRLTSNKIDRSAEFRSKIRGSNRYYAGAKELSDVKRFIRVVEGYVNGEPASIMSKNITVSRQTVSDVYQKINDRLIEYRLELLGVKSGVPKLDACACYHYFYFLRDGLNNLPSELTEAYTQVASIASLGSYNPSFSLEDFYNEWDRRPEIALIERYSNKLRGIPPNKFPGYFILAEFQIWMAEKIKESNPEVNLKKIVLGILKDYPLAPDTRTRSSEELMSMAMPIFVRHKNVGGIDEELPDHMPLGLSEHWKN